MITCERCSKGIVKFYSSVGPNGVLNLYCESCYSKIFLDNFSDMNAPIGTDIFDIEFKCECGTKNPLGMGHSHWCGLYKKEF